MCSPQERTTSSRARLDRRQKSRPSKPFPLARRIGPASEQKVNYRLTTYAVHGIHVYSGVRVTGGVGAAFSSSKIHPFGSGPRGAARPRSSSRSRRGIATLALLPALPTLPGGKSEQKANFCLHAYAARGIHVYSGIRMTAGGDFARPPTGHPLPLFSEPGLPKPRPAEAADYATRGASAPRECLVETWVASLRSQ
jgi:hypothetical protein